MVRLSLSKFLHVIEKHMISLQAKVAVESVKAKLHEIDLSYGISEKASSLQKQATDKVKQLDEQYKISEKAKEVGNQIKTTTTTAVNKVSAVFDKPVARVRNTISSTATTVWDLMAKYLPFSLGIATTYCSFHSYSSKGESKLC